MSIIIVGLFDLMPVITPENLQTQLTMFKILIDYALFAFMINFLREIIKDIEDIEGDVKAEMRTLPIVIGKNKAIKLLFVLSFIPLMAIVYYVVTYLYKQQIVVGYFLLFIIAPLLYFIIKILNTNTKKELHHLSNVLKLIMFFGILSLLLYKYILIN